MHESQLFAAQKRGKKIWKILSFLSKITFEPDSPGTWKRGKRAKWIRWDIKRPGVAPCEGHFVIYGWKWQRQLTVFGVGPEKTFFFSQKSVVKTSKIPLCTPENTDNNFELHDGSAKPISSWWKIAQNGKKCTKVENGVSRKRQVLSSRSSYANQNAPTERIKGRSTKVCSGPWLLAPTVQKIWSIFLKNHDF